MTAHSLLGASAAHRWLNCPGSFALSRTAPHRPTSVYAATGTLAHEYIEQASSLGFRRMDAKWLGQVRTVDGHDIEIDQDFLDGVNVMIDYLAERHLTGVLLGVEQRVSLDGCFNPAPPVPVFGTLDAAAFLPPVKTLEIIDYKNGSKVVSPVENSQLMFYAAGAMPLAKDDVRNIRLTIVQPHAGGAPIRSWDLAPVDLAMWIDDVLVPGVEACTKPDAPIVPGSWCHFCPVSHACPVLHADAVEAAQREFDDIADDATDLALSLDIAERAELWIKRVREFAEEQLKKQVHVPGWGLVPTRPTRKWLLDEHALVGRLAGFGLLHEDIWDNRIRSPAQLEKQLKTRAGRKLWPEIEKLIEARSSGFKVGRTGPAARDDFDEEDAP